jgi:hypothetical protein
LRAPFSSLPSSYGRTVHTTGLLLYYARAPAQTDVISLSLTHFSLFFFQARRAIV